MIAAGYGLYTGLRHEHVVTTSKPLDFSWVAIAVTFLVGSGGTCLFYNGRRAIVRWPGCFCQFWASCSPASSWKSPPRSGWAADQAEGKRTLDSVARARQQRGPRAPPPGRPAPAQLMASLNPTSRAPCGETPQVQCQHRQHEEAETELDQRVRGHKATSPLATSLVIPAPANGAPWLAAGFARSIANPAGPSTERPRSRSKPSSTA